MATTIQLSSGKILLSWTPPDDSGGRTDLTYSVECQRCEGSSCQPCGDKIHYDPSNTGLSDTKVSVSELDANLNYTFTVEAHSGVSVFGSQAAPSTSALTTSLHYTGDDGCWHSVEHNMSIFLELKKQTEKVTLCPQIPQRSPPFEWWREQPPSCPSPGMCPPDRASNFGPSAMN